MRKVLAACVVAHRAKGRDQMGYIGEEDGHGHLERVPDPAQAPVKEPSPDAEPAQPAAEPVPA